MKRVYIAINGILNFPGGSRNWTGRAVTWLHLHDPDCQAEKVEYFCTILGRALGQPKRERKLFSTLGWYQNHEIHLIGHSNGCAVILQGMQRHPDFPKIEHLHLVSGACEASFMANGLNHHLITNKIGKVSVYVGGEDRAMKFARRHPARWLGYGCLGYAGPLDVAGPVAGLVRVVKQDPWSWYGHSTCWQDENFDQTMRNFLVATPPA